MEPNRHAAFAEVEGRGFVSVGAVALDRKLYGNPQLKPPLALHQRPDSAETGSGALAGERLEEHEMGAHFKAAAQTSHGLNQRYRESSLVDRCRFHTPQYAAGFLRVGTIDDDGLKTLASDLAYGRFCVGAKLHPDFQIAQDAAQNAHRFIVATQQ
jgi:hypothetical protein